MLKLFAAEQLEYYEYGFGYNCDYEFPIMHTHDYWEFFYALHDVEHIINGVKEIIHKNTIYIIRPKDVHLIKAHEIGTNKGPNIFNIKTTSKAIKELTDTLDLNLFDKLCNDGGVHAVISESTASFILKNYVSTLLWSNDINNNLIIIKNAMMIFLTHLYPNFYQISNSSIEQLNEVEDIVKKMNDISNFNKSIKDMSKNSHYSYMQLTRLFKDTTGLTMQDYFLNIKLSYAASQLKLTNDLIENIANEIGISSLSHFNQIFKKKYNMTPGKYRKVKLTKEIK